MRSTEPERRLDAPHYIEKRDGSFARYLDTCGNERRNGLFLGPQHYRDLWDAGLLTPEITSIRIMYNSHRQDEHYIVISRDVVEGVELQAHSGKQGQHPIENVIPDLGVMFEVSFWARGQLE